MMNNDKIRMMNTLCRILGMLEGLSSMEGATITKKTCLEMGDMAGRLDCLITDYFSLEVSGDEEALQAKPY